MSATAADIAGHQRILSAIRIQSEALLRLYERNFRLASVFATQQRWLLAHAALSLYFKSAHMGSRPALISARFLDEVVRHKIASRNTADAFVQEMIRYKFAERLEGAADKRARPIAPAAQAVEMVSDWAAIHLASLDFLDGGERAAIFARASNGIGSLQPAIADSLMTSPIIRAPQATFSLFTWLNNGGILLEWFICRIADPDPVADQVPTAIFSMAEMAPWLKLSRTQLARKLREAEAIGSLGWNGPRDRSPLWVSRQFLDEMISAQAVKLTIIDAAFDATLRSS